MLRTSYSSNPELEPGFLDCALRSGWAADSPRQHVPTMSAAALCRPGGARVFKGRIRPGDVYLLNDPYRGETICRSDGIRARIHVTAGVLVDQPLAPERHRRRTHGPTMPAHRDYQEGFRYRH